MVRAALLGYPSPMFGYRRARVIAGAKAILDAGGWCVFELCTDVPAQTWEAQLVIFDLTAEAVADVVGQEVAERPEHDARLTGCDRSTLAPNATMGAHLVYLAGPPAQAARIAAAA
jgi:hypothetical protein